jgi:hypothetical protein
MFEDVSNHNGATYAKPSCLTEASMASRTHGVLPRWPREAAAEISRPRTQRGEGTLCPHPL